MKISCLLLWLSRRDAEEKRLIIVLAERTARQKAETIKPSNLCGREAHVLAEDTTQEVAIVNEHFKSQYAAMAQQARRERKTIDNRFSGADRSTKSRNNKTKQLMRAGSARPCQGHNAGSRNSKRTF